VNLRFVQVTREKYLAVIELREETLRAHVIGEGEITPGVPGSYGSGGSRPYEIPAREIA
jgi:hypothetical protein